MKPNPTKLEKNASRKCACGLSMANYPWTKMCRLCWTGRRRSDKSSLTPPDSTNN